VTPHSRHTYAWFARAAERFGYVTALEVGTDTLTYRALQRRAERLATRLVAAHGGRLPTRVGLLAGRTVAAYVGYLAVLRVGAAVVPLNPESPPARNAAVTRAAGLDLVVMDSTGGGADLGVPVVVADPEPSAGGTSGPTAALPSCPAGPDDVAYVLFTSGSTGIPKGVPVLHRNVAAYLRHMTTRYDVGPGSRLSQAFDLTFDGSVHDLFVAWACGATLVVPRRGQLLSPVAFVNAQRLTHWFSVPSVVSFATRLDTLEPGCMPTLRWSVFGGEPLTLTQAEAWQQAAPMSTLVNLYGPTEATVSCTEYRLPRDPATWPRPANGTVPIGACHPTVDHVLLDEDGRPGSEGELCVRGSQRFPGYLDPADDVGRFVTVAEDGAAQPYAGEEPLTDAHWYRTGDRVAVQDGLLVHQGRTDHQVKIRGHRIELGEIEALLREGAGAREAVVTAVEGPDGEPDLHAAVSGTDDDTDALYAVLAARFPRYMVPRRITVLDALPRNANGKVDRRALTATLADGVRG
jgi:amino acid adenylation domain-containing protein